MSNDEMVKKLERRLKVSLKYSSDLEFKRVAKPDKTKLQKLADKISKELEELSVEDSIHQHASS